MSKNYKKKDLDIVIFGATGFTGQLVVEEFCRVASAERTSKPAWAIAGRSEKKLLDVANIINMTIDASVMRQPETIAADVDKLDSIREMASRAKVVINCVGPYRLYGEVVVKACIENGTDYVDVSGETEFIERTQITYNESAKVNSVTIVPACGFDSLPSDFGFLYTKQQLESRGALPSSIEFFFRYYAGPAGAGLNFGTYNSLVLSLANVDSLRQLRQSVTRPRVPKIGPELKKAPKGRWMKRVDGYVMPFFFADPSVIGLSQQLDAELQTGVPPVQFAGYAVIPKLRYLIETIVGFKVLSFLAHYEWGRWLLLKFPKIFTFGLSSKEGPTLEQIQQGSFTTTFYGRGYSRELLDTVLEQPTETTPLTHNRSSSASMAALAKVKPDVEIVTQVSGPDPGYGATPIITVQCALTLLREKSKIPSGVLTTSVAFRTTDLLKKLIDNGITFRVVEGRFELS